MNSKIKTLEELVRLFPEMNRNKTVVFTDGVFNGLTDGHLAYLHMSKYPGAVLVVGLYSDSFTRERKGADRKFYPEANRARALAFLPFVDYVVIMESQNHKYEIIRELSPNVVITSETTTDDANSPETIKKMFEAQTQVVVFQAQSDIHTSDLAK
jgi:bifunctional ADP-heptose synthase (sugar kinase/adenylyltransferase)